jgi:mono/diheme cytochrome c family protein
VSAVRALLAVTVALGAGTALAQDPPAVLSDGWTFDERDGASLYRAICQGCHMPDGRGAEGAGRYPALAGNGNLASAKFVVVTVLQGRRAMPTFKDVLDDDQVAEVVNFVRANLGNRHADRVTADDVRAAR